MGKKTLVATDNGGEFKKEYISSDSHPAVCIAVFDLGTQETNYNDKLTEKYQVMIMWEVDEEYEEGDLAGQRKRISKKYTLSLNSQSKLYKDLCCWFGKDYIDAKKAKDGGVDLYKLLGLSCLLSISKMEKDDRTFNVIDSIAKLPKGLGKLEASEILEDDGPSMPDWVADIKAKSPEFGDESDDEDLEPEEEEPPKQTKKTSSNAKSSTKKKAKPAPEPEEDDDDLPFGEEDIELEDEDMD